MVTTRKGNNFAAVQKRKFNDYLNRFCTTYTLTKRSNTYGESGRLSGQSTSTTTIKGDLQYVTDKDRNLIELGWAVVGDGMFFTPPDSNVALEDEIVNDGVSWKVTAQIEGEETGGEVIYVGFIVKRISE